MPIHLVTARREERILLVRARCRDVLGCDDPNAHAFIPPGIDIPRVMQGHVRVRGVQRADVHMIEAALAPKEHLVQWPVFGCITHLGLPERFPAWPPGRRTSRAMRVWPRAPPQQSEPTLRSHEQRDGCRCVRRYRARRPESRA